MSTEEEYKSAKLDYDRLGIMNTPVDPAEAAELLLIYKKAKERYVNAINKLHRLDKELS